MDEQREIIERYREKSRNWQRLLSQESDKRQDIIAENEGDDSVDIKLELSDYAHSSGLRELQITALEELKAAEAKLFSWVLRHCDNAADKEELRHLTRDYAGRITYLRRYLSDTGPSETDNRTDKGEA